MDDDFLAGETELSVLDTTRGEDRFIGTAYKEAARILKSAVIDGKVRYPFAEASKLTHEEREQVQESFEQVVETIAAELEREGKRQHGER